MSRKWTLNDLIDFVTADDEDSDDENEQNVIAIEPPTERPEVESDCDSDKSDDENLGEISHLPRRILNAEVREPGDNEAADNSVSEVQQPRERRWKRSQFR